MEFGIKLAGNHHLPLEDGVTRMAKAAEELGYDSVWVPDHVIIPDTYTLDAEHATAKGFGDLNWPDPMVSLAYIAGQTRRVKLGTAVMVLPLRNPLVTAKMLATLDILSGGRAILGAGAGWLAEEFPAVGAPDFKARGAATDEWIQIFRACWGNDVVSFDGQHYKFPPVDFRPRPKAQIPIWIGGNGPRALRRAGELGDGWHGTRVSRDDIPKSIAKVKEHAVTAGRDTAKLSFAVGLEMDITDGKSTANVTGMLAPPDRGLVGSLDEIIGRIKVLESAGVTCVELRCRTGRDASIHSLGPTIEMMQRFAETVMPAFKTPR